MKRMTLTAFFVLLGATLGILVAGRLILLVPNCGEDCGARILGIYISWTTAGAIIFGATGFYWSRLASKKMSFWLYRIAALVTIFICIGGSVYIYKLEKSNTYLQNTQEIQPTNDFPEIVITQSAIPVFADINASEPNLYYQLLPGERCALGYKHQDRQPARVEILCRKGIGWISQAQEAHLKRISNQR